MNLVILSRSANLYSTNSLVQAAIKRKHNVRVVDPLLCDIVLEQGKPVIYFQNQPLKHIDAVIPRIGSSITYKGKVLISQFEAMNVFTTLGAEALTVSRDKLQSLQKLTLANIDFPKTIFPSQFQLAETSIDYLGGAPVVLKLIEGTQGMGVVLAETKNAAESMIDAFKGMNQPVMLQEFIKESKGSDIRVFVVDNEIVGAIQRQGKEGEFRSNLHRGGSAKVAILSDEEKKVALQAAKTLGLKIAGIDMLQSDRGPLVLEVNSSPGLEGIELVTKKDIAKSIIRFVEKSI